MKPKILLPWLVAATIASIHGPALAAQRAGAYKWRTYQNDRYGTTIDYPDFFEPRPAPAIDDGREFKSADGGDFLVFASFNALDFDLGQFEADTMKNLASGEVVTYRAHGANWFVISGRNGDKIFYERHLLSHGGEMIEGFVISYPAWLEQTYAPIVARMAKSFRPGTGFQTPQDKP